MTRTKVSLNGVTQIIKPEQLVTNHRRSAFPVVKTVLPMAYDGVGPSFTCVNLLRAMNAAGMDCHLAVNRHRMRLDDIPHSSAVPSILSPLPYRFVEKIGSRITESRFLRGLKEGEVAYLWPSVSLETHRQVLARGNPILMEGINTRMASAKRILDEAYAGLGLPPGHGITDARIAEEEAKYETARGIFAPSPQVEAALAGSPLADAIIPASYGVAIDGREVPAERPLRDRLTVLFVGYASVRKGIHLLLEAWRRARIKGDLILVGHIEGAIRRKYADTLNRSDIHLAGFQKDVSRYYSCADIFVQPALEEGDPLVTYEAAAYGLPLITSPMGAGRMGTDAGCTMMIEPGEVESLVSGLRHLVTTPDERREWGVRAFAAVQNFSWTTVGARRANAIRALMA